MADGTPSLSVSNIRPTLAVDPEIVLPDVIPVRQSFPRDQVADVEQAVRDALSRFAGRDLAGKSIAITGGSRGIKGMVEVLRTIVAQLRDWGADPFLVPAMGSHGGASAEGQIDVMAHLGMTEAAIGAPIRSSMDTVELGRVNGTPVYCDKLAMQSDGIVVCNRIKPHTAFKGEVESGIVKMLVIGLGKHVGATATHRLGFDRFREALPGLAALVIEKAPILMGVGIIENAYDGVARIVAMKPDEILAREPEELLYAKRILGRLLISGADILIVDEIGKDVSGGGMDSNVTGRSAWGLPGFEAPPFARVIARDLSKATAGSAVGLGLADFCTRRCAEKIDLAVTYTNAITALVMLPPKIPIIAENDWWALVLALQTLQGVDSRAARIVRVRNTKSLQDIWLSTAFAEEIAGHEGLIARGPARPMAFDETGYFGDWAVDSDGAAA